MESRARDWKEGHQTQELNLKEVREQSDKVEVHWMIKKL
jgi:hypothetical protein